MKKYKFIFGFSILLFVIFGSHLGVAKANTNIVYAHAEAEKLCGDVPNWDISKITPYNPKVISRLQTYTRVETFSQSIFVCMKTSLPAYRTNNGIGWVVSPAFSQVGYNASGAYYLGTEDGRFLKCNNPIYKIAVPMETFEPVVQSTPYPKPNMTPTPTPFALTCGPGQRLSDNGRYCVETQVAVVQACPTDIAIRGKSRFVKDRLVGGFWKKLFSFGLSTTGTLISGGNMGTAVRNGFIGVALQTGQTMINPSEGAITLSGAGLSKPVILSKGAGFSWADEKEKKTYRLVWDGDVATVYSSMLVQGRTYESACYSYTPKEASNLGVYITGNNTPSYSGGADKIQPLSQIPVRPVQAPTTSYPIGTMGYCTRPVAGQPAQLCQIMGDGSTLFLGDTGGGANLPIFKNN